MGEDMTDQQDDSITVHAVHNDANDGKMIALSTPVGSLSSMTDAQKREWTSEFMRRDLKENPIPSLDKMIDEYASLIVDWNPDALSNMDAVSALKRVERRHVNDFERPEDYRIWLRLWYLFQRYDMRTIRVGSLKRIPGLYRSVSVGCYPDVSVWRDVLMEDSDRIVRLSLSVTQRGVHMRQLNPFKGIMTQDEVSEIIREYRDERRGLLNKSL